VATSEYGDIPLGIIHLVESDVRDQGPCTPPP
jgi:hypothetical protein